MQHGSEANPVAHPGHEPHVPGVTHDATLRPVGILMIIVGCLWALFITMGMRAGDISVAKASGALILAGVVLAAIGKRQQQI
jgi:threonine/homoserine efflux transporter RhtA